MLPTLNILVFIILYLNLLNQTVNMHCPANNNFYSFSHESITKESIATLNIMTNYQVLVFF